AGGHGQGGDEGLCQLLEELFLGEAPGTRDSYPHDDEERDGDLPELHQTSAPTKPALVREPARKGALPAWIPRLNTEGSGDSSGEQFTAARPAALRRNYQDERPDPPELSLTWRSRDSHQARCRPSPA